MTMSIDLLIAAGLTGFCGDFLLQIIAPVMSPSGWGLNQYFQQHGGAESLFIASGIMSIFYILLILSGIRISWLTLSIYGIVLDLAFRTFRIFPSLDGYYHHLNYFWSAFWGVIPMMIPLALTKVY